MARAWLSGPFCLKAGSVG